MAEAGTKGRDEESAVITLRDRCRKSYSSAVPVSRLSTQVPAYVDETEHLNCGAFCGEYHSKKSERQTHTMKGTHLTAQGYPRDRIPDCQNADDSAYLDRLCSQLSTPAKCADVLAPRSYSNSWSGPHGYAKKQLPTEDPTELSPWRTGKLGDVVDTEQPMAVPCLAPTQVPTHERARRETAGRKQDSCRLV